MISLSFSRAHMLDDDISREIFTSHQLSMCMSISEWRENENFIQLKKVSKVLLLP